MADWFGPPVDVPLDHIVSVQNADPQEARRWNMGIRLAGIQIPGFLVSGLFRQGGKLSWWHVRRRHPAVAISLRDERFARIVVESDDPSALKSALLGQPGI